MALQLLSCSICPRQQQFSDISHLLTHVSSKGHLAHLHKLQVRSHQEISASVQLANHNQWYQQYGLAQLLSERMLMKEAKKVSKRVRNGMVKHQNTELEQDDRIGANLDQSSPVRQVTRNRARNKAKRAKRRRSMDDYDSGLDYSPIQGLRRSQRFSYLITPVKKTPLPSSPPACDGLQDIDPALVTPPNAKLKGTIWPGMDLFDAATPEAARRRNQRKDGSVVKRMERLSKLVEPKETVYTRDGEMRKQRHIDDLEDNSSLIEGETPVTKYKPRPKRKPLARVSVNVPRLVQRKPRTTRIRSTRRINNQSGLPNIVHIPSSSAQPTYGLQTQYSPTEEENAEFQLAVRNMQTRKRTGNFTIFTESAAAYPPRLSNYLGHHMSLNQAYNVPVSQRLVFPGPNPTWLQPQNQSSNPLYLDNSHIYRHLPPGQMDIQDVGKENVMPMTTRMDDFASNPLSWRPDDHAESASSDSTFGIFSGYFGHSIGLADPFGYSKNPLAHAFEHFSSTQNVDPTKFDDKFLDPSSCDGSKQADAPVPAAGE